MVDGRFELPADIDERTLLIRFLEFQRDALVRKCAGLTDEQLRRHAVPSSNLTLLGLVRHLAGVERWYFQGVVAGDFPGSLYTATDDPDEDFNDLGSATGDATFTTWQAEVERSRRVTAERALAAVGTIPGTGHRLPLRWVLTHMIDEYARHLGQADLIREALDGAVGE
ncbi:MAG: hypothetical protein V7637_571 [Mycobacteriales bacterium]